MSEPTEIPDAGSVDEAKSATQLGILLDAAVHLVDEQNRITERLDAKARNQLTIAAAFFAGVQAGVISLVGGPLGPSAGSDASPYIPYLLGVASVAVVTFIVAVLISYRTWKLRPAMVLSVKTIRDYIPFARQGRSGVGAKIVTAYTDIVQERQRQNAERAAALRKASWACALTLVVVAAELILGFSAVIDH